MPDSVTTDSSEDSSAITEKTPLVIPIKITVARFLAVLAVVAGLHPLAMAQVRSIVREENSTMKQDLTHYLKDSEYLISQKEWEKRWNAETEKRNDQFLDTKKEINELQHSVKELTFLVVDLRKRLTD